MKINLEDVIEAIEFENESLRHFYNKETGIIIYVEDEESSMYHAYNHDELDKFEEWEQELIESLYHYEHNKGMYIQLPSKEDINEEGMMKSFIISLDNELKEVEVLTLSFRELRDKIEDFAKSSEWFDYRENYEEHLAKEWCEQNNIKY